MLLLMFFISDYHKESDLTPIPKAVGIKRSITVSKRLMNAISIHN